MNETRVLAHFARSLQYADLSRPVIDKAIDLIIDQLGIQIACATLPWSKQITTFVKELGGRPDCTVVYYGFKTSPDNAAFLNSSYGHGFEMDDTHLRVVNHPGCLAIPPALAICEREQLSGKELVLGAVIGLELICRVSAVTGPILLRRGHNTHPPNAPFGIAAACARLMGLDEEGILNAMAIAGSHAAAGLREYNQTGGTLKRLHGGIPAQAGVRSALLAKHGITGPPTILEGKYGFCRVFCAQTDLGPMVEGLGAEYIFTETSYKQFCTVYFIQPALEAARQIIERYRPDPRQIKEIVVGTSDEGVLHAGTIVEPRDVGSAQYSTAFSVALRFTKGGNGFREYVPENLADRATLDLARRVRVEVDEEAERDYPNRWGALVTVNMENGETYQHRVRSLRGSPDQPMSRDDLREKFRTLVVGKLSPSRAERLLEQVENVEALDDVTPIASLMVAG